MSNHVFVSHSHHDAPAAESIVRALEERGVPCWMAPRDVPPGGSYAESILTAIESARCFVLIYSEHSNVSSHVLREVERALKFDLNIVPIRFDDSAPSKSLDYLLATVHWLAIAPESKDRSILKAAEQIAASLAASRTAPSPTATPGAVSSHPIAAGPVAPLPRARSRSLWIAALVVVAGSLVYWAVAKHSESPHKTDSNPKGANGPPVSPSVAARPSTSPLASPELQPNELPVAVTHRYFSFLAKRNATAAYNLLSEDFRRRLSIVRFSRTVGSKPLVKVLETTLSSKTDLTATVAVAFEDTDPTASQAHWKGDIDFVLESGAWRIDSMKGLYPASGRPIHDSSNGIDDETGQNVSQQTPAPPPVTSPTPVPSPTPAAQKMRGIVSADGGATLHKRPFARADIVTPLRNGDVLEIDRIEGDWLHATTERKKSGFVHKSKVRINP